MREINRGGPFPPDLGSRGRSMSEVNVGRRLISVSVSLVTGVSGLVQPGHRVDLFYPTLPVIGKGWLGIGDDTALGERECARYRRPNGESRQVVIVGTRP